MRIVVQEWERVLVHRDGRFERELGPGRHQLGRWRRRVVRVAVRPRLVVVPLQEVLTADGLPVKVSLTATVRVTSPRTWHEAVDDPDAFLHTALQLALREEVVSRTLDQLLAERAELSARLRTAVASAAAEVGLAVERLAVRDVVVPPELRHAAAEVATARALGLASLERARSEVAATRALANAAKLVDAQPGLLQLRTLQAVEAGGATVVLTSQPSATSAAATP
ncbi:SPFH domain-containing protein [Cellulomonas sp. ATA003]|uniref:SPFH domain-containing protein n=1 Tax=Cellulomonas sp. ATA003 TaxID=3073064 RepID=UPI0028730A13|nr:SPFH domain-containing protein [Cellulomonas sp. ATA003]WNB86746.1 SPFH domain-containing protein [Cellulomonas sp. ATA003]